MSFNPSQPRDQDGKWSGGGSASRRGALKGLTTGLASADFLTNATAFVRSGKGRTTIDIAHPLGGIKQTLRSRDERGKHIIKERQTDQC